MALPRKLEKLVGQIKTQSEIESTLLSLLVKRLEHSVSALGKVFGSDCSGRLFEKLVNCALAERTSECFDLYEEALQQCINDKLRRLLTEAEEEIVDEIVGHITGITELLLTLGGITLAEVEDEAEGATGNP